MLCGGTLAFNDDGEVLAWARKPGTQPTGTSDAAAAEQELGIQRRREFLDALARRVATGRIGTAVGGAKGLMARSLAPLTSRMVDGTVRFELSPHYGISSDRDEVAGGRAWQISS